MFWPGNDITSLDLNEFWIGQKIWRATPVLFLLHFYGGLSKSSDTFVKNIEWGNDLATLLSPFSSLLKMKLSPSFIQCNSSSP